MIQEILCFFIGHDYKEVPIEGWRKYFLKCRRCSLEKPRHITRGEFKQRLYNQSIRIKPNLTVNTHEGFNKGELIRGILP
jgi:hypothetical protein